VEVREQPYSFSVFIARRSGSRGSRTASFTRKEKAGFTSDMVRLAETKQVTGDHDLEGAQFALRRCLHLVSEMARIADIAPEAAAMVGRSVVECALIGSYLALHKGGGAAGLMKKQRGHASALRSYFLTGDMVAALTLLPDVAFISDPLSAVLDAATGTPDLRSICSLLDNSEPFKEGKLATLLYYETYAALSNLVVHATPHSIERHRRATIRLRGRHRQVFDPATTFSAGTLRHAVLPAIGGLCGCLARALDMPSDYYDAWLKEVGSVDSYEWSGSIVRTAAVEGLTELVELPGVYALNTAGFAVRAVATLDTMISAPPAEQLIVACEIIDRARVMMRRPRPLPIGLVASYALIRRSYRSHASDETRDIASGHAAEHPQALLAALALIYAGLWPDNPDVVDERLVAFDQTGPHDPTAFEQLVSRTKRRHMKNIRKKRKDQIAKMQ